MLKCFIHAVGVDLHEKLRLVKESNSNANLKRARKPAQFFAPEEVYVIEDDNEAKHKSFAQRPPDSIESKRESSSILNLLDEELEEEAKNFPLSTPNNAYSPSSGGLILTRKRSSDQEKSKIRQQILLDPLPESTGTEQIADDHNNNLIRKHHITAGSSVTTNLTDESSAFFTEILYEHNSVNQPGSSNATLGTSKDAMVISGPEPGEVNRDAFSSTKTGTLSVQMLSLDISMVKNSKHLADLGSSIQDGRKDKPFPSDSKRQCRSLASTDQAIEVDSFLGFQSVFSFL
ncbi:DExH-box ATP-dependent RNA helicase DExH17 isoform X3 [Gossypium australe]|uniref:DExH-box ATP-dependent RNA helicase DExH17 isoform X3 n=1 Tax=Gossypium australe TaxID=47621 RepID=A0A5B6W6Q4_9ROSI|nr:DExH-box ATP-dependent RNA helicase DExH17 isoform X3 [Gossypium australe]